MKKQIAVLMAAATAVTTVAPALASADVNTYSASVSEANAKIKAALNERYKNKTENGIKEANPDDVDAYMNSRYAVAISTNKDLAGLLEKYDIETLDNSPYGKIDTPKAKSVVDAIEAQQVSNGNNYIIKDAGRVQGLIENLVISGGSNEVKVIIVDKGMKDGSAVQTMKQKHYVSVDLGAEVDDSETQVSLESAAKTFAGNIKNGSTVGYVKDLKVNGDKVDSADDIKSEVNKIEVTLQSGKEYTLEVNDKAFDLEKAVDAKGNEIDLTKANAQNVLDQIEGFKYQDNYNDKSVTLTLPVGDTDVYELADVQASTINLGKIFTTKDGYTKEGADLVNAIVKSRNAVKYNSENPSEPQKLTTFNFRGNTYEFVSDVDTPAPSIEKVGDGYVLKYTIEVNDLTNEINGVKLQFVIDGESQKDLATVLTDLQGQEVVAGRFTRLEGSDRYATAVAVSQERFDPETADTVVIAGGEALMDGLSAVPLAAAHNAPILLASPKSGLNNETLKEIKRVTKNLNRKTVYVVGGENSVPASVVKQLENEFGATVQRLSGSDRFETSLDVARNLKNGDQSAIKSGDDVFIVGGDGAADAMSISPVAASGAKASGDKSVAPILVVPKDNMKKTTRDFIVQNFKGDQTIIGGESTVSSSTYRNLVSSGATNVSRVSGSDRFDTNVQIIEEYYAKKTGEGVIVPAGLIVASGDNKFLVDAQTAGPLALEYDAPILLTGSKLTNDQINLLKKSSNDASTDGLLNNGTLKGHVYQVGGVVSADVMSVVVDKLGL